MFYFIFVYLVGAWMTYMMLWLNTLFQLQQQHQALISSKLSFCKAVRCLSASQSRNLGCYLWLFKITMVYFELHHFLTLRPY